MSTVAFDPNSLAYSVSEKNLSPMRTETGVIIRTLAGQIFVEGSGQTLLKQYFHISQTSLAEASTSDRLTLTAINFDTTTYLNSEASKANSLAFLILDITASENTKINGESVSKIEVIGIKLPDSLYQKRKGKPFNQVYCTNKLSYNELLTRTISGVKINHDTCIEFESINIAPMQQEEVVYNEQVFRTWKKFASTRVSSSQPEEAGCVLM